MTGKKYFFNGGKFLSPGKGRHPVRVIDSHELIFVVSGKLYIYEEDRKFEVNPGEFLRLNPHRVHGGFSDYEKDLIFYWGHFSASEREMSRYPKYGPAADPAGFAGYFEMLLAEQNRNRKTACDLLLEILLEKTLEESSSDPAESAHLADGAERLLRLRFSEPLSTASVAGELGCNADYLGRVFHKIKGCSLTERLNAIRLRNAAELILNENFSIKEAAFASGFNDMAYFRRRFFRTYSVRPSLYRKLHSGIHVNAK